MTQDNNSNTHNDNEPSREEEKSAIITFNDVESVHTAIAGSGVEILGKALSVQPIDSSSSSSSPPSTTVASPLSQPSQPNQTELYVGNVDMSVTETELRGVFERFGTVNDIRFAGTRQGHSHRFAFVSYSNANEAAGAIRGVNSTVLYGRPLKVSYAQKSRDITGPSGSGGGGMRIGSGNPIPIQPPPPEAVTAAMSARERFLARLKHRSSSGTSDNHGTVGGNDPSSSSSSSSSSSVPLSSAPRDQVPSSTMAKDSFNNEGRRKRDRDSSDKPQRVFNGYAWIEVPPGADADAVISASRSKKRR